MSDDTIQLELHADPARKLRKQRTISAKKKLLFLKKYAETANFTLAAETAGFHRTAFYQKINPGHRNYDQQFAEQFQRVEQAFLDQAESCLVTLALQPTREGFQDRKLLLQAKRPEIYGNKTEITANHNINIQLDMPELRRILQQQNVRQVEEREAIPLAEAVKIET